MTDYENQSDYESIVHTSSTIRTQKYKKIQDMVNALVLKDQLKNDQERYLVSNQIFQCLVHVLVLVLVLLHYPQKQ